MIARASAVLAGLLLCHAPLYSQQPEAVDLAVIARIRDEGLNRSRIVALSSHLTDVIGPRLTGSSGMRRANEWAAATLREWGFQNVAVEAWGEFGRGWERVSFRGNILSPYEQQLVAFPRAWTGSTRGAVTGPVVFLDSDGDEDLQQARGTLRGAVVMVGRPRAFQPELESARVRSPLDTLLAPGKPATPTVAAKRAALREWVESTEAAWRRQHEINRFFLAEGVVAVLRQSQRAYGNLTVDGSSAPRMKDSPIPVPELVVDAYQYAAMYRNLERKLPVAVNLEVQNRWLTDDLRGYNTLGEIPGTDKRDEYVMIGAHLDSWHSGQGATDNGAGSVIMLEAVRILKSLGVTPRRTIRIALWSGEEEGLQGSRNWVANHRDLWPRISAYLNIDNGTGRVRGIWNQSNARATSLFDQLLRPFRDLGVVGVRDGDTGGSDHLAFDAEGMPGFNFIQDPIEYSTRTHHSMSDMLEALVIPDLQQAAVVVAATVYHLAMRDEMVPRVPEVARAVPTTP